MTAMSAHDAVLCEATARALVGFGEAVRSQVVAGRDANLDTCAIGYAAGDMIYGIDKRVEPTLLAGLSVWPASLGVASIVAEGLEGSPSSPAQDSDRRVKLLIDPIDGTRGLMYDKRSAWFLAAAAPDLGDATRISDAFAAVMVEIPTSKQTLADVMMWSLGGSVRVLRKNLVTGGETEPDFGPSRADSLKDGFAQVSNFFPGVKRLAADLMEHIAVAVVGDVQPGSAAIFEDQYISTGGQFAELLMGHDRFCCDLRPIFYDILKRRAGVEITRGLCCHPYDAAGLPILRAAGIEVTDGFGAPLDAPFGLDEPVHWCGYANAALRRHIEPVIQEWIKNQLAA